MYLVQCFLPLHDNERKRFPREMFDAECRMLMARFGGLTAYTRAPLEGLWTDSAEGTTRDDLIIYEVMVEHLDWQWWGQYRSELERRYRQQQIVIRAQAIELL